MNNKVIKFVEKKNSNGIWEFYCYLPYKRYVFGTVHELWQHVLYLVHLFPKEYRISQ